MNPWEIFKHDNQIVEINFSFSQAVIIFSVEMYSELSKQYCAERVCFKGVKNLNIEKVDFAHLNEIEIGRCEINMNLKTFILSGLTGFSKPSFDFAFEFDDVYSV
ncbi:MAG: hypothetical protein EOP04_02610 [Proteobacteria bacterium]|nr:MAG: hypothetical protein EOP04_02610 [Pseudomonadota bacterium]